MRIKIITITIILFSYVTLIAPAAQAYDIGVFYFPGWLTGSQYWKDIKGEAGSRSPGVAWPDRLPLLGYYPEEETWVAERHIEWASSNGITFFAYDWYWYGTNPDTEHAQQAFLKAKNSNKLKFCLHWANHSETPKTVKEFDDMVLYWINNYFNKPAYFRIEDKPVIFIFSHDQLEANAAKFGESAKTLLARANNMATGKGYKGIYLVAITNGKPNDDIEKGFLGSGYNAYTGWNYVASKGARIDDYDVMVDSYLDFYAAARTTKSLPYIATASPGWDSRPWSGNSALVRTNPTPEKFTRMLRGAKQLMDSNARIPKILMIEAWNEFGEGSYIEPTKKWGFGYLEAIKKVFSTPPAKVISK
jgi:hypothetical protein